MDAPWQYRSLLAHDEADLLFSQLVARVTWDERMKARKTASFGVPYDYSGITYPVAPWSAGLATLRDRVAEAVGWTPNNALLNLYETGKRTMGWHADAVDRLEPGTGIAIVSLGARRTLSFRRVGSEAVVDQDVEPGSLLVMPLAMQAEWQHAVRREPGAGARISVTFRSIVDGNGQDRSRRARESPRNPVRNTD